MMIRLKELREAHDLSVKDMCARLGVADSRYRKWESGTNGMPLDYALQCCSIFRCTLDDLAGRKPTPLSDDERHLLDLFRRCSLKGREFMIETARTTASLFPKDL